MEEYIKKTILVGVFSWTTTFFLLRKIFPKRSFDFCNRIVSTIHAILAVTLATLSVQDWKCPICPVASKSSPQQVLNIYNYYNMQFLLLLSILFRFLLNFFCSDASSSSEPFISNI
jgi:hypothetical protein